MFGPLENVILGRLPDPPSLFGSSSESESVRSGTFPELTDDVMNDARIRHGRAISPRIDDVRDSPVADAIEMLSGMGIMRPDKDWMTETKNHDRHMEGAIVIASHTRAGPHGRGYDSLPKERTASVIVAAYMLQRAATVFCSRDQDPHVPGSSRGPERLQAQWDSLYAPVLGPSREKDGSASDMYAVITGPFSRDVSEGRFGVVPDHVQRPILRLVEAASVRDPVPAPQRLAALSKGPSSSVDDVHALRVMSVRDEEHGR